MKEIEVGGKYRHFKGNEYHIIGIAKHSGPLKEFVVSQALYGAKELWVRPRAMFLENVETDDKMILRFEYIGEA